jgi:3-oxoacyl-[acyl-carrier protein] reductase
MLEANGNKRFVGKTALVTGGSRGIGRAIVELLAREGAKVYLTYLSNTPAAEEVQRQASQNGGSIHLVQGDVRKQEDAIKIVDKIIEEQETLDILVNNAGVVKDSLLIAMDKDQWDDVIDTNLGGVFHFTRAAAQHMMMQKHGRIVNISSYSGNRGGKGQSNYAASKAAVNAFTRAVALELAPKGVTVNAVAPGMVETDMSKGIRNLASDVIRSKIPLGRHGQVGDIAKVVAFLASDDAAYITGEVISVDGGLGLAV